MSAKIYGLPKDLRDKVPNIWNNSKDYKKREDAFIKEVSILCKERNSVGDQKYIGETIKFQVADGYAIYMVAGLKPLQLIHLPLMDGYEANDVDLMTAKRVKEKVDSEKKLVKFFNQMNRVPTDDEVNEVISLVGIDTTEMSEDEFKTLHNSKRTWETKTQFVRWNDINYLIPTYGHTPDYYGHHIYKYLCNHCKVDKTLQ